LIRTGKMFGEARLTMQAALTLSEARAKYVQKLIGDYADQHKINLNVSQIQTEGVGIREPLIPKPRNMGEARKNMRVEFRIVKREVEATEGLDFNF
jgi:flagellar motor protein MotB